MTEPPAPTLVEVVPAPANQPPPAPADSSKPAPAAPPGAVPGVPLAVAVANALGGLGAGALSLGGPAPLAVAGAAGGVAVVGGLVRRARNRRTTTPRPAPRRQTAAARSAAGGLAPAPHRGPARHAGGAYSPGQHRQPAGHRTTGANSTSPSPGYRPGPAAVHAPRTADPKGPSAMARTAGTIPRTTRGGGSAAARAADTIPGQSRDGRPASRGGGGLRHRSSAAAHTLARAASRLPGGDAWTGGAQDGRRAARDQQRLARVAERTARRVAKGQAKAERAAGIDPATGAGARPNGPAARTGSGVSPVQATALRRSARRHRARMAGVAAATGLVGLASAVVGNWRHRGRVAGHMRRTWQRLTARARAVREARDAAILGTPNPADADATAAGPAAVPVPAETVNVPGRPAPAPATAGFEGVGAWTIDRRGLPVPYVPCLGHAAPDPITLGKPTTKENATVTTPLDGTASTFNLTSAADVLLQAATTFDPETMIEFGAFADDLPVAYATIQEVLRVLAELAAERLPLDPSVVEEISQGYQAMGRVVHALEEVGPTFRQAHAEDLERHENPRNGLEAERKWNV
ncbi:hypothetical protein ACFXDE_29350 [Kitasatospora sp. NPDC059408]|uniref:hypothetical protein n=1 Tax=Kitasatospora sp. NPDC059408 TaxID=3346823 RepID=UPI003694F8F0